jgi:hypothetical protein
MLEALGGFHSQYHKKKKVFLPVEIACPSYYGLSLISHWETCKRKRNEAST